MHIFRDRFLHGIYGFQSLYEQFTAVLSEFNPAPLLHQHLQDCREEITSSNQDYLLA